MEKAHAPFTEDEIKIINDSQDHGMVHPYTCCSPDKLAADCMRRNDSGSTFKENQGILIATKDGMICPCGKYKQDWVYAGMLKRNI
jgi:hypothetical protein